MALRIGQSQLRFEDDSLVRGAGSYTGDDHIDGEVAMYVVRSSVAAGIIREIDTSAAREAPGVLIVLTGKDALADGLKGFVPRVQPAAPDGGKFFVPPTPPLRDERVRYVGDPIAIVVAETRAQAESAAELVAVDLKPLRSVTTTTEAMADGARWYGTKFLATRHSYPSMAINRKPTRVLPRQPTLLNSGLHGTPQRRRAVRREHPHLSSSPWYPGNASDGRWRRAGFGNRGISCARDIASMWRFVWHAQQRLS